MADPVHLKLKMENETPAEFVILMHPATGMMQSNIPQVLRLTNPSIAGTGAVGSPLTYTAGTNNAGLPVTAFWCADLAPFQAAVVGTPYVPVAADNGKKISIRESINGFETTSLTAVSNEITATDSGASGFPANLTQAQLDQLDIYQITNPADPDYSASNLSRVRLDVGTLPAWASGPDFEMTWGASATNGGVPSGSTKILPSSTYSRTNSATTRYYIFYARRLSDGAYKNVTPISGHTGGIVAHQVTLSAIATAPTEGQGVANMTTPPAATWIAVPTPARDEALTAAIGFNRENNVGSSSNMDKEGSCNLLLAYAGWKGDATLTTRNRSQMVNFLTPGKDPWGPQGPSAAREIAIIPFFWLMKNTPAIAATAAEITAMDLLVECMAIANAFIVADGQSNLSLRGCTKESKSIGSNIGAAPPLTVAAAAAYFGPNVLADMFATFTMADLRTRLATSFNNTTSLMYRTFNWRNEGVSATAAANLYRCGASSAAPTDTLVQNTLRTWKYYTNGKLPNVESICFPNSVEGLNNSLPPGTRVSGSQPYVGLVQWAQTNKDDAAKGLKNQKVVVNGVNRAYCINNGASTPNLDTIGSMVWEWAGNDAEGLRSSMFYGEWTIRMVNSFLLTAALSGNVNLQTTAFNDFFARWRKAKQIWDHWNTNDYNSLAHERAEANGGAGMTNPLWSAGKSAFKSVANAQLWETVLQRMGV